MNLKAERELFDMLVTAAGVDGLGVKSITCHCEVGRRPTFDVQLLGVADKIKAEVAAVAPLWDGGPVT